MTPAPDLSRRAFAVLLMTGALGLSACASGRPAPASTPTPPVDSAPASVPGQDITVPAGVTAPTPPPASAPGALPPEVQDVIARRGREHARDWGMHLSGIRSTLNTSHGRDGEEHIALTFDACGGAGGSGFDAKLIGALVAQSVPATLFLNSRWIQANSALAEQLFAEPLFEIGNHGTRHRPLSVNGGAAYGIPGTASAAEVADEVWRNHELIRSLTGKAPRWFRAGTAHYDDVAVEIVHDLDEVPLGFAVNGDGGATFSSRTVTREVGKATAGDVVLAHMNQPDSGTADGMIAAIAALRDRGVRFVHID